MLTLQSDIALCGKGYIEISVCATLPLGAGVLTCSGQCGGLGCSLPGCPEPQEADGHQGCGRPETQGLAGHHPEGHPQGQSIQGGVAFVSL